ncbi:MAG: putative peptidase M15 [Prokaryotic dsDNA virus sp.]|nr:MAG: putative peptidase M15 [Prokaryotic dsDNA virus sp.]|tara:strand:- start:18 stop:434 length:417 start_codon:yes stop_codon:yes gene_type:complete
MSNKLSKNFKKSEFKCRDGTKVPERLMENLEELVENLQIIRDFIGVPMHIISGYRTPSYNKKIGGSTKSQHMKAKAADIVVKTLSPAALRDIINHLIEEGKIKKGGVGLYRKFVHYDVRGRNTRWYGKGMKDYKGENV